MQASVAALMDDVTDPSDWKKDFAILRNLDASLRCDLCFNQHRQHHARQSTSLAADPSNIAGPSIAKRPQTELNGIQASEGPSRASSPRRSKRIKIDVRSSTLKPTAGSQSSPLMIDDDDEDLINATDDERDAAVPSRARRACDDGDSDGDYVEGACLNHGVKDASSNASDRELKADDLVECPICSHTFTVNALNRHLDSARCYAGFPRPSAEDRGLAPKPTKTTSSWFTRGSTSLTSANDGGAIMANEKKLVRPQYNLKSDRDIRKLLDDAGLPTSGDREKMVERHRQWVNLWNSNLDSTRERRSAPQLRKELAVNERAKYSAKDHSAYVDRQKTSWVKSNKSQFDHLIQTAKMGALRDKKLRDAAPSSEDATDPHLAASNNLRHDSSELEPHVITSSPAMPEAPPDATTTVGTVGADA
ncbi:related to postreplication repair protein uvsH/nuvA [Melanopsichium pennsylvanicum]|uniref:RING-type E3 ubiquitin transferase n=1 Tax=Melanopsichium pennsylvanicum TaxID=63383 RepID=A0AAJ4XM70_9BASI|nr:related to postreplication repair protein uvsH/nuvA [Melanopsichium pennsylvanicum]